MVDDTRPMPPPPRPGLSRQGAVKQLVRKPKLIAKSFLSAGQFSSEEESDSASEDDDSQADRLSDVQTGGDARGRASSCGSSSDVAENHKAAASEMAANEKRLAELKRRQANGELTADELDELQRLEARQAELSALLAENREAAASDMAANEKAKPSALLGDSQKSSCKSSKRGAGAGWDSDDDDDAKPARTQTDLGLNFVRSSGGPMGDTAERDAARAAPTVELSEAEKLTLRKAEVEAAKERYRKGAAARAVRRSKAAEEMQAAAEAEAAATAARVQAAAEAEAEARRPRMLNNRSGLVGATNVYIVASEQMDPAAPPAPATEDEAASPASPRTAELERRAVRMLLAALTIPMVGRPPHPNRLCVLAAEAARQVQRTRPAASAADADEWLQVLQGVAAALVEGTTMELGRRVRAAATRVGTNWFPAEALLSEAIDAITSVHLADEQSFDEDDGEAAGNVAGAEVDGATVIEGFAPTAAPSDAGPVPGRRQITESERAALVSAERSRRISVERASAQYADRTAKAERAAERMARISLRTAGEDGAGGTPSKSIRGRSRVTTPISGSRVTTGQRMQSLTPPFGPLVGGSEHPPAHSDSAGHENMNPRTPLLLQSESVSQRRGDLSRSTPPPPTMQEQARVVSELDRWWHSAGGSRIGVIRLEAWLALCRLLAMDIQQEKYDDAQAIAAASRTWVDTCGSGAAMRRGAFDRALLAHPLLASAPGATHQTGALGATTEPAASMVTAPDDHLYGDDDDIAHRAVIFESFLRRLRVRLTEPGLALAEGGSFGLAHKPDRATFFAHAQAQAPLSPTRSLPTLLGDLLPGRTTNPTIPIPKRRVPSTPPPRATPSGQPTSRSTSQSPVPQSLWSASGHSAGGGRQGQLTPLAYTPPSTPPRTPPDRARRPRTPSPTCTPWDGGDVGPSRSRGSSRGSSRSASSKASKEVLPYWQLLQPALVGLPGARTDPAASALWTPPRRRSMPWLVLHGDG